VNQEAARLQEEERAILVQQKELQGKRQKLQDEQESLIAREAQLLAKLEDQAEKLSKLDSLQRLAVTGAKRKLFLANQVKRLEADRAVLKRLAQVEGQKRREAEMLLGRVSRAEDGDQGAHAAVAAVGGRALVEGQVNDPPVESSSLV